jgi:hypothetical protein
MAFTLSTSGAGRPGSGGQRCCVPAWPAPAGDARHR